MRVNEAETRESVAGTERGGRNLLMAVAGAEARAAATGRTKVKSYNCWKIEAGSSQLERTLAGSEPQPRRAAHEEVNCQ